MHVAQLSVSGRVSIGIGGVGRDEADPLPERARSGFGRIPAVWLVIAGIASVQCGAAIAKDLFDLIPPTAMVWLRLLTSALIFLIAVRPRLSGPDPS